MLKASSLLYAVFICFIIALFCGSIILISNLNHRVEAIFDLEERLLTTCSSSFNYYLNSLETISSKITGDYLNNGITSEIHTKKWGLFDIVSCKSFVKNDTVYKTGIVGDTKKKNDLALYLTDTDKTLYLAGKAIITGTLKTSKYGVGFASIENTTIQSANAIKGTIGRSEKTLPKLIQFSFLNGLYADSTSPFFQSKKGELIYNSFFKPTLVFDVTSESSIEHITLRGNIIVKSEDSLFVSKTAILEDIIIDAPIVIFENGFTGIVQVFATKKVNLNENVTLKYPSSIYINNDLAIEVKINFAKNSTLIGGVILTGDSFKSSKNNLLNIEETSRIIGDVYCYGKTQLRGKIIGTLYTSQFYLETTSSKYDNYLLDGEINAKELPEDFLRLSLFENKTRIKYELVKEL